MHRFFNLVKNEYIKNLKRVSTKVMLVLVLLAAIALPVLAKVVQHYNDIYGLYGYDSGSGYTLNEMLDDYSVENYGDDGYAAAYRENLQIIIDSGATSIYDWRKTAFDEMASTALSEINDFIYDDEYDEYMLAIENGEDGYTVEGAEKLYNQKFTAAYELFKKSDEYTTVMKIISDNDMTGWYDYLIKQADSSSIGEESDEYDKAYKELNIWYYSYLRDNQIYYCSKNSPEDWLKAAVPECYDERYYHAQEIYSAKAVILAYEYNTADAPATSEYNYAVNQLALCNYMDENNIDYNVADTAALSDEVDFWTAFYLSSYAIGFVGLLVIVIAALSVSSEFANGTIKFLLINPVKRWKILTSKYFTVISSGYIMLFIMFVISMLTSLVLFGGSVIGESYITAENGKVIATSGMVFMAKTYLMSSVQVVVMSTLAFAISTLMKSSAFAIGISMFGMLAGNSIVSVLAMFKQDWARYLIFANTNLAKISQGEGSFMYQDTKFALTVIAVHMVIFLLIAWDGFTRREI